MAKILIIDDNAPIRRAVEKFLTKAGHDPVCCMNGAEGLETLKKAEFDLILTDLKMPVMTGLEFLEQIKLDGVETPVILLTGHGSIDSAVEAMKMGASDYLAKPLQFPELNIRIERLLEKKELLAENRRLRSELNNTYGFEGIIGQSAVMKKVFDTLRPLTADREISVLIYGETGTGKELVAKSIHYSGPRKDHPFVAINCGAIPGHLLESELFGHEEGAFTDARKRKKGLFESAEKGTLFLDEIDSLPIEVQVKLLRALEERTIRRVGATADIPLDIRLISASSSRLESMVESGNFRSDLYFRIAVAPVHLPPLRRREGDILLLARHFADKKGAEKSKLLNFSKEVLAKFESYSWPGNVRELENLMELLVVMNQNGNAQIEDLPPAFRKKNSGADPDQNIAVSADLKSATKHMIDEFERKFILDKLVANHWNISRTAEVIGLSRASLHTKIKQLNLKA